ncbi:Serine-type D-Ala-D-Ala carboxypeptidase [Desulfotomaculum nigrificans CO-1-SRB]|uniref:serine-type D-Ala-D-Ala carboxypeptidase n=1 Tax=Desulfotomaculum nigrificans (strain DSM 14880 / VKM B-2319 / CO-1-SRB) TaxID=868595 RepID=F6B6X9_DESCC|nr:Serine-type D-Ala-D-Ala carboxypeptidase [Desulfotomaculum nigrificans CO-1-SRB]
MHHKKVKALLICTIFLLCLTLGGSALFGQEAYEDDVFFVYQPSNTIPAGNFGQPNRLWVSADAAILMDATTGQVLYEKNAHKRRPIASTTKIMTALLAIECGNLKSVATVSKHAAGTEGSSIYLRAGEKLTLEHLLYGALMHSGNDACVAIAEHIAGKEELFVNLMNYKAYLLGARNTHFANTNGLPHDQHLSTAYDLALITRHALKNPVFKQIVATRTHKIKGPQGLRYLANTNQMLWSYQGANGVKTGTTNAAGKCLVSSATRDGRLLIAVVLHAGDRYADSIRLLDYGFQNFTNHTVVKKGEVVSTIKVNEGIKAEVPVVADRDLVVTIPVKRTDMIDRLVEIEPVLQAPIKSGQKVGGIKVKVNGQFVTAANLITKEPVDLLPLHKLIWHRMRRQL